MNARDVAGSMETRSGQYHVTTSDLRVGDKFKAAHEKVYGRQGFIFRVISCSPDGILVCKGRSPWCTYVESSFAMDNRRVRLISTKRSREVERFKYSGDSETECSDGDEI